MFRVPLANPSLKRLLRPLFAQHQATPKPGLLDPTWDRNFDIYPGSVMTRLFGEVYAPYTGAAGQKPFGLSAFFVAPKLGVDEVLDTGSNLFAVWVGNNDAEFEVLAPAFDATADWTTPTNGSITLLTGNNKGLLTPTGATAANAIAELLSVNGTEKITIRPVRPTA